MGIDPGPTVSGIVKSRVGDVALGLVELAGREEPAVERGPCADRLLMRICPRRNNRIRTIYRVALDCIPPTRRDVFTAVLAGRPVPVGTTPARALEDLQELGLVERDRPNLTTLATDLVEGSRMQEVLNME